MITEQKPKRHRHEQSMWLIGNWMWCYQCGAIRAICKVGERWEKPTGIGGENPAMSDLLQKHARKA